MSGDQSLVSVVISTFNCGAMLRCALESVLAQDYRNYEVLVVGDGCTDNSEEIVNSFGDNRLNWINLQTNSGSQALPNNHGIRHANGKYIAYLNHDDLWFPGHLSVLVKHMEESGDDFAHTMLAMVSPTGVRGCRGPSDDPSFFIPPSTWIHKADLVQQCGYWKTFQETNIGVDREFKARVAASGKRISFVSELTVLIFDSLWFKAYENLGVAPQRGYLEKMAADPQALERAVLIEACAFHAKSQFGRNKTAKEAFQEPFNFITQWPLRFLGTTNWPLSLIADWLSKRDRRKRRIRRGLPASGPLG